MTKKEVGESLIQIGSYMLALPFLLFLLVSTLYVISLIEFGIFGIIALGCLAYFEFSIGLIIYGKKLMK